MDLNTIAEVARPRDRDALPAWREGDAWLGGGTWLLSEPQPHLRRLVDLAGFGWPALTVTDRGLQIAATCTIAQLDAFAPPPEWHAAPLFGLCCRAFLASFKVWNTATVGGNLCMALPAGPMIALAAALRGSCTIWMPDGRERRLPVVDFVLGPQRNALLRGEILRMIELPAAALGSRAAFRQISLSPHGRSAALLIGTRSMQDGFRLTVTASTRRPVQLAFGAMPSADDLAERLAAMIPDNDYYDDSHGSPAWRRHMTFRFAEEIRGELGEAAA